MEVFNEKKLVTKLDKILKKEFGTNLAFREFSAGYGIADLVFASNYLFSKKTIKRNPITNFHTLSVYLILEQKLSLNNIYTIDEIFELVPQLPSHEVKKQLRILSSNDYITKVSRDKFKKAINQNDCNPINKVIAIEVKLVDHKHGLMQARRYQYFADESYLAILKKAEKNIDMEEFNRHNIGLILFDDKKNTIEIKQPGQKNFICNTSVNLFAKEMMMSQFLIS